MENLCKEIFYAYSKVGFSEKKLRKIALKYGYTREESFNIYNKILSGNGLCFIPSIWESSYKNTERGKFILSYLHDIQKYKFNNTYIGDTPEKCIRLMTYNVHYWKNSLEVTKHQEIVNIVKKYKPDIFGFQEVLIPGDKNDTAYGFADESISHVLEPLGYYNIPKNSDDYNIEYCGVFKLKNNTEFGNMIGCRVGGLRKFLWTEKISLPSNVENRCAIMSAISLCQCQFIIIIVVHLDVFDSTGETRKKQIKLIMRKLKQKNYPNNPIIIMGDFNCMKENDYNQDEKEWLSRNSIGGLDFETIKLLESFGYKDLFLYPLKCSTWTGRRVDFIFGKNIPENWSVKSSHVIYEQSSDHLPLVIDLKIYQ